jgi:hypothetical protein
MKPNDYLERIRIKLKGFSPQEKTDFIDEIASHIESGQEDASFGEGRVMAELGTPEEMERGLRKVHRPNQLVNLLLLLIPELFLFRFIQVLLNVFYGPLKEWTVLDPHLYLGGRIALALALLLAVVGLQRRSVILIIFWLTDAIGTLVSLMTREGRFIPGQERVSGSTIESLLLYAILIGLVLWLVKTLKQNKFDLLLVVYALLPLTLMAANYSTAQILRQSGLLAVQTAVSFPIGLPAYARTQLFWVLGVSVFFLFRQRSVRWFGILLVAVDHVYASIFSYNSSILLLSIWSAILGMVLSGWILDWFNRRGNTRLVG